MALRRVVSSPPRRLPRPCRPLRHPWQRRRSSIIRRLLHRPSLIPWRPANNLPPASPASRTYLGIHGCPSLVSDLRANRLFSLSLIHANHAPRSSTTIISAITLSLAPSSRIITDHSSMNSRGVGHRVMASRTHVSCFRHTSFVSALYFASRVPIPLGYLSLSLSC